MKKKILLTTTSIIGMIAPFVLVISCSSKADGEKVTKTVAEINKLINVAKNGDDKAVVPNAVELVKFAKDIAITSFTDLVLKTNLTGELPKDSATVSVSAKISTNKTSVDITITVSSGEEKSIINMELKGFKKEIPKAAKIMVQLAEDIRAIFAIKTEKTLISIIKPQDENNNAVSKVTYELNSITLSDTDKKEDFELNTSDGKLSLLENKTLMKGKYNISVKIKYSNNEFTDLSSIFIIEPSFKELADLTKVLHDEAVAAVNPLKEKLVVEKTKTKTILEKAKKLINELKTVLEAKEKGIKEILDDAKEKVKKAQDLYDKAKDALSKAQATTGQREVEDNVNKEMITTLLTLEKALNLAKATLDNANIAANATQKALDDAAKNIKLLKETCERQKSKENNAQKDLDDATQKVKTIAQTLVNLRKKMVDVKNAHDEVHKLVMPKIN